MFPIIDRAAAYSWRLIVIGIVVVAALWLLRQARVVFFPVVVALFLARALSPVVAAPDDERGSVVRAIVVLREGHAPTDALARELQDHVKDLTAPYKYPRIVEFADDLPKTTSGKIRRALLRGEG